MQKLGNFILFRMSWLRKKIETGGLTGKGAAIWAQDPSMVLRFFRATFCPSLAIGLSAA